MSHALTTDAVNAALSRPMRSKSFRVMHFDVCTYTLLFVISLPDPLAPLWDLLPPLIKA